MTDASVAAVQRQDSAPTSTIKTDYYPPPGLPPFVSGFYGHCVTRPGRKEYFFAKHDLRGAECSYRPKRSLLTPASFIEKEGARERYIGEVGAQTSPRVSNGIKLISPIIFFAELSGNAKGIFLAALGYTKSTHPHESVSDLLKSRGDDISSFLRGGALSSGRAIRLLVRETREDFEPSSALAATHAIVYLLGSSPRFTTRSYLRSWIELAKLQDNRHLVVGEFAKSSVKEMAALVSLKISPIPLFPLRVKECLTAVARGKPEKRLVDQIALQIEEVETSYIARQKEADELVRHIAAEMGQAKPPADLGSLCRHASLYLQRATQRGTPTLIATTFASAFCLSPRDLANSLRGYRNFTFDAYLLPDQTKKLVTWTYLDLLRYGYRRDSAAFISSLGMERSDFESVLMLASNTSWKLRLVQRLPEWAKSWVASIASVRSPFKQTLYTFAGEFEGDDQPG